MEKQSVRGAMCKLAEEVIARRAEDNDASLIDAIIHDPHSDFVCIPASYLASLPEIVSFVPALDAVQREKFLVAVLMESSEHLKANKDKEGKVTIRTEYKRNPRNTLLMHSVPADAKEEDLLELFKPIPTAASVSFKMDVNSCWLATFDTEANAVATHSALSKQKLLVKGKPISVGLRATRFIRVTPQTVVPAQQQVPPAGFNMRQGGMSAAMRQQYAMQQQYYMQTMPQFYMQQYYAAMQQQQPRAQRQAGWGQQKPRSSRGGHQRYQNGGHQQQRNAGAAATPEQAATPATAAAATASTTPATTTPAAAAPQHQQPQQQQQREGQRQGQGRGGRNYRGRNRSGGSRGHGSQDTSSESASSEAPSKEHRQRQSAGERQEQTKHQEKPTADSFPPLM